MTPGLWTTNEDVGLESVTQRCPRKIAPRSVGSDTRSFSLARHMHESTTKLITIHLRTCTKIRNKPDRALEMDAARLTIGRQTRARARRPHANTPQMRAVKHAHTHTRRDTQTHPCGHSRAQAFMHTYTRADADGHEQTHTDTRADTHTRTRAHTHADSHAQAHIHTRTHTAHKHIHTKTRTRA